MPLQVTFRRTGRPLRAPARRCPRQRMPVRPRRRIRS